MRVLKSIEFIEKWKIEVEIGENVLKSTKIEINTFQGEDLLNGKWDQIIGKHLILINKTVLILINKTILT